MQEDNKDDLDKQTLARIEQSRQNAKQWLASESPPSLKTSVRVLTKMDGNTTSYSMKGIKVNAPERVEQDVDLVLKNTKIRILGQPHEEMLNTTDSRYKHYKSNEDCIFHKDGLFSRNFWEKLVASNSTNSSSRSNKLMKYSGACTESLENTREMPKQKLLTARTIISQKWRN